MGPLIKTNECVSTTTCCGDRVGFFALSPEDMRHLRWDGDGDEDVTKVVGQPSEKGRPLRS